MKHNFFERCGVAGRPLIHGSAQLILLLTLAIRANAVSALTNEDGPAFSSAIPRTNLITGETNSTPSHLKAVHAQDSTLSLSISIPSSPSGERVLDQARTPHFHVILSNSSDKPQSVWAPWSEAGYGTLSLEFADKDGKKSKAKKKMPFSVSHELPEICVLQPRENLVFEVHFANSNSWENFPQAVGHLPTLSMRAVFEVRASEGTAVNKIWAGKIVSEAIKVTIYPWQPR